jgi:hypothetical protein
MLLLFGIILPFIRFAAEDFEIYHFPSFLVYFSHLFLFGSFPLLTLLLSKVFFYLQLHPLPVSQPY